MRILLILLQTVAFLALLAAVLFVLYYYANSWDFPESNPLLTRAVVFVFGNWFADLFIFIAVALINAWFVLGPLMKVEDPIRRTVQHLSVIFIQTSILLAVGVLSFVIMVFYGIVPG